MGNTCSSKVKKEKTPDPKTSGCSNISKKSLQRKETQIQKEESNTNTTIQKTQPSPAPVQMLINPPPNLFLAVTMSSSGRQKFLSNEESVETICERLTNNDFNEFLLKEKSISKLLGELVALPKQKLCEINKLLVEEFNKVYAEQLKAENEKMLQTLSKLFNIFLDISKSNPQDHKFEEFNKSFVCFLITVHHVFKNVTNFANLHQTYFHKDCSRPVSHDKMFLEEKSYIYTKDLTQMPFWIGRGVVMNIVDNILKNCFYNQKLIHTIRDERFLDTWNTEHVSLFGRECDHTVKFTSHYLFTPKGFNMKD